MVEMDPEDIPEEEEEEVDEMKGPRNWQLAEDYACGLDDIMCMFKNNIASDEKDAMVIVVSVLKK